MSHLDDPNKQKSRESLAITPGQLRDKLDGMRRELLAFIEVIAEQQKTLENIQENRPDRLEYINDMVSQINSNKETLVARTDSYNRALERYQRRMSHLQKIKN